MSTHVNKTAGAQIVSDRITELTEWNENDLKMARLLRGMVAERIAASKRANRLMGTVDLRSLAGVVETAQRVARLALGAATANTELSGPGAAALVPAPTLADFYAQVAAIRAKEPAGAKTNGKTPHHGADA